MAKVKHPTGKNRAKILSGLDYVDYKEPILALFIDIYGRIVARRYTGLPVKKQKELSLAVKRARFMCLLPFVK